MTFSKHYTLEEARSTLEEIRGFITEMVGLKQTLTEKGYDVFRHQYFGGHGPNGQKYFPNEMERLVEIVKELSERGIEIKDIDKGLIDFPHIRSNGEEVYLCYMHGETEIVAWHPIEGGFGSRRSLDEL